MPHMPAATLSPWLAQSTAVNTRPGARLVELMRQMVGLVARPGKMWVRVIKFNLFV